MDDSQALEVRLAVLPKHLEESVLEKLTAHSELGRVNWVLDEPRHASILILKSDSREAIQDLRIDENVDDYDDEQVRKRLNNLLAVEARPAERIQFSGDEDFLDIFIDRIDRKMVFVPIPRCITSFSQMLKQREKDTIKLLSSTPKTMVTGFYGPKTNEKQNRFASIQLHHPKTIESFGNKKLLDSRGKNRLSRKRDNYTPFSPIKVDGESVYSSNVFSLTEHVERATTAAEKLADLGVTPDKTNMSYTQINIGMPFFGELVRENLGLNDPKGALDADIKKVSEIHIRGLAATYNSVGETDFEKLTTRASVPTYSYQGPAANTTLHTTNQVMWASMLASDKGIFEYEDLNLITGVGFRLQGAREKIRPSYIVFEDGKVGESHVIDGIHKEFLMQGPETLDTVGFFGARVRHVDNPNHCQNHALLPVPSFVSDTKSREYKLALNVSFGTLTTMVPGTIYFAQMWEDAWNNLPWVQDKAKERGITSLEGLITKFIELGEFPFVGDIGNFDGSTPWPIAQIGLEHTMSERAYNLTEKIWFQPTIGCYTGANNEICYYTIDKRDEATAKLTDMLGSGIAVTSSVGRQVVPGVLGNAARVAFDIPLETYYELPTASGVSFFSLTQRNAGDDHAVGMLAFWLWTGTHPKECRDQLHQKLEDLRYYHIEPEDPPLIAGYLAHLGEDGRLVDWSLSPNRFFGNNVYPEDTKNAIGLDSSINVYLNSADSTSMEEPMNRVAEAVRSDVYNFATHDQLVNAVVEDEETMADEQGMFTPTQAIALQLGIPESDLFYKYSMDELIEMGADEELLSTWKKPLPEALTRNPFRFFNEKVVKSVAADLVDQNNEQLETYTFDVVALPPSREIGVNYATTK